MIDSDRQTSSDFAELFTVVARHVMRSAGPGRLTVSFDCTGPSVAVPGDGVAMHCSLYRMLSAAFDVMDVGQVALEATVRLTAADHYEICVSAAGRGSLAGDAGIDAAIGALQLQPDGAPAADAARPTRLRRVSGACPLTGGRMTFACSPSAGFLLRARWQLRDTVAAKADLPQPDLPQPDARRALAWLVGGAGSEALEHRLQRLGWQTRQFSSAGDAARRLRGMRDREWRPHLLAVTESPGACRPSDLRALRRLLPPWTRALYCALPGSTSLVDSEIAQMHEMRVSPLSPRELRRLTREVFDGPKPGCPDGLEGFAQAERPLVLVANDDEVDRLVTTVMVRSLGYDAISACDGEETLDHCRRMHPDAVLVDLDGTRADTFEVTGNLRELQRAGRLPPFAIVAANGLKRREGARPQCADARVDGWLAKPVEMTVLDAELLRLCAGCVALSGKPVAGVPAF